MKIFVFISLFLGFFAARIPFVYAGPTSANYELKQFGFGGGSVDNASSTNFNLNGILAEESISNLSSTNFKVNAGLNFTYLANVPPAPTFTNPDSYYNKLKIVINTGSNASDAKYAIAISSDNFASDTRYVQNDNTVGSTLGSEDWQTYTNWGGASGVNIIGLSPNTTYTVKVAVKKGNFTQTGFGPTAQAATIGSTLSFDIDVASTDIETSPPYNLSIGDLAAGSVITATNKIWVDLTTNGTGGGTVYVYGTNNGLLSTQTSSTITSATADLSAVSTGYGAKSSNLAQSSGGPMEAVTPYNGTGENVGVLDTSKRIIFDSSAQPVTSGRAAFQVKAKASTVTVAASDYTDTLTVVASATF